MTEQHISTALCESVIKNESQHVETMLRHNSPDAVSIQKLLFVAICSKSKKSVKLLLQYVENWKTYPFDLLALAALVGKLSIVRMLVEAGCPGSEEHFKAAYVSGNLFLLKYLLENTNVSRKQLLTIGGGEKITVQRPSLYNKLITEYDVYGEEFIRRKAPYRFIYGDGMAILSSKISLDFCSCHKQCYQSWSSRVMLIARNIHFSEGFLPNLREILRTKGPYNIRRYYSEEGYDARTPWFPKEMTTLNFIS